MLLNNQWITEEIKEEIKKYLETNDSKNMTLQNVWDTAKVVLKGKFIAIQAYLEKQEKSQVNNLTLHLKQLEETNDTKYMTLQNVWDTAKVVLKGKFIAIQAYLKKQEKSQVNNLSLHLKQLEKEKQTKPKVSRRKEIIKIRAE